VKSPMALAMLIPVLAVLTIVVFAGGLGIIFMLLESTEIGEWGVVILGTAIVVLVPTAAALLEQRTNQQ
jgi:hypothetical protein